LWAAIGSGILASETMADSTSPPAATPPDRPTDLAATADEALARIARRGDEGVWITLTPRERLLTEAQVLTARQAAGETLPLFGLLFGVKDNIDVAGLPTTAGCPAFAYTPAKSATVVSRLQAAGALCLGKTNLDQFATGLSGVRSPYGVPRNLFDDRYIVGGSSSGSGVAVGAGVVDFALGTDTAGSGRVPAAFNNIVGLKPSRGVLSTAGVVPACPSLDCVSIFAPTVEVAARVATVAAGYDAANPFSRRDAGAVDFSPAGRPPRFRFGVPAGAALDFLGDAAAAEVFERALARLQALGGTRVEVDFAVFREAGALVYDSPIVAERLLAAGRLLAERPDAFLPVIRQILEPADRFDARAVFQMLRRRAELRRQAAAILAELAFLIVPTSPTIYRIDQVEADPIRLNATLGAYTNFVNPLDLAAIAVPTGFRADGLPAGATLVGPWGTEGNLAAFASALHHETSQTVGATGRPLGAEPPPDHRAPADWIPIAVLGAHLAGEPLNHQLTGAGGRFLRAARTAPRYRFYALPNTQPPKPGLARVESDGVAIELEVWALPAAAFGNFVARIPPPLCIGSLELEDGARLSGFLCEGHALAGAQDISRFGGWRAYRRALAGAST
jgi:allophanate hydrolase